MKETLFLDWCVGVIFQNILQIQFLESRKFNVWMWVCRVLLSLSCFFRCCCCRFSYHLTAAVGRGSEMLSWFLLFSFSFCFHWIYLGILWFLHFMNSWRNVALFLMKRLKKGNILELILECHWVFSFIVCRFVGGFLGESGTPAETN